MTICEEGIERRGANFLRYKNRKFFSLTLKEQSTQFPAPPLSPPPISVVSLAYIHIHFPAYIYIYLYISAYILDEK